jgi:hypothetical protein
MASTMQPIEMNEMGNRFLVVHPLDDAPERKVDTDALGPMPMTTSVRISLLSLRVYLIFMMLLVLYRVLAFAGMLGHRP